MTEPRLVLTCEHAGNQIPAAYRHLFEGADEVLRSHRGWDPGAKTLAVMLSRALKAPLFMTEVSRLLVECNRSRDHHQLFSAFTADLSSRDREQIMRTYYDPYRDEVASFIAQQTKNSPVIHISVHSFTPIWNGLERATDIGLLYDEQRESELQFCGTWQKELQEDLPQLQIDLNEPYNGADDGFTTYLRTQFKPDRYLGIELEVNQKFNTMASMQHIEHALFKGLQGLVFS